MEPNAARARAAHSVASGGGGWLRGLRGLLLRLHQNEDCGLDLLQVERLDRARPVVVLVRVTTRVTVGLRVRARVGVGVVVRVRARNGANPNPTLYH